jgi:hypothetical protein
VLVARLKKCEELLKSKGIDIDGPQSPTGVDTGSSTDSPSLLRSATASGSDFTLNPAGMFPGQGNKGGQLLVDHGKSRFIENNLWTSLSDEVRPTLPVFVWFLLTPRKFQAKEAIAEYSEDEDEDGSPVEESTDFMFGYTPTSSSIQQLHPTPDQISGLWQVFLDNINPMTKIMHQPTFQATLVKASSNLENLPKGLEALMFSIYGAAVFSIDDDECVVKFGEPKKTLLARYRHATRKALARARFMGTSDIQVLQAFLLYLLTMREEYDSRTVWTLAGVASRMAQGMGIHRDGTTLGVSPFETEMRRRLWWQIAIMDFRSAELSGSGRFGDFGLSDTQPPSNVNDADIFPEMTAPPVPQTRPTEMIACLLRCEFGHFWKEKMQSRARISFENLRLASTWLTSLEERDAHIDELERRIEEKYLKYCDPSIPIQLLCMVIGRAAVNSMRLMAHHPRKYANPDDVPASERDYIWDLSVKLLESDNLSHASKGLRRFMWHSNVYFQWQALVYLLNEMRTHAWGDRVDRAWEQVDEIFAHHPNFVTDNRKPLHVAVGSLCLKAYSAREAALREKTAGVLPRVVPDYIQLLRGQRQAAGTGAGAASQSSEKAGKDVEQTPREKWPADSTQTTPAADWVNPPPQPMGPPPPINSEVHGGLQPPVVSEFLSTQTQAQYQMQNIPTDQFMFASDPNLVQDLAMADMPMDWVQWDYLMQDFETR